MLEAPDEPVRFDPAALDPFASPWRPGAVSKAEPVRAASQAEPALSARHGPVDFNAEVAQVELRLIDEAMAGAQGHQGRAAEALGLTYHQFRGLLKKHGYGKKTSTSEGV